MGYWSIKNHQAIKVRNKRESFIYIACDTEWRSDWGNPNKWSEENRFERKKLEIDLNKSELGISDGEAQRRYQLVHDGVMCYLKEKPLTKFSASYLKLCPTGATNKTMYAASSPNANRVPSDPSGGNGAAINKQKSTEVILLLGAGVTIAFLIFKN
jgi:hypothetical protein